MAKFKPCKEDQLVMLPISLVDQLVPGTLEHTISQLVDKHIDLSVFDERYNNDQTGASAIHPKILLKVILLAYSRGMIRIERACHENIIFITFNCENEISALPIKNASRRASTAGSDPPRSQASSPHLTSLSIQSNRPISVRIGKN